MQFSRRPLFALSTVLGVAAAAGQRTPPHDIVITNATVMTVTHGTIEHASVWVHDGKIAGFGRDGSALRPMR